MIKYKADGMNSICHSRYSRCVSVTRNLINRLIIRFNIGGRLQTHRN